MLEDLSINKKKRKLTEHFPGLGFYFQTFTSTTRIMNNTIFTLIRIILGLVLLRFVYMETGPITTLVLTLVLVAIELDTYRQRKTLKHLEELSLMVKRLREHNQSNIEEIADQLSRLTDLMTKK